MATIGNARGSGWAPSLAWSCSSGATDTPLESDTWPGDVLRTTNSGVTSVPATRLVVGRCSSRNTPGAGSPAATVLQPGVPWNPAGVVDGGVGSVGTLNVPVVKRPSTGGSGVGVGAAGRATVAVGTAG
jgi:hypothetical protein